jgi:signal peptidase I
MRKFGKTMNQHKGFWREYKGLVMFIGCMLVFRSALADWNYVPSSSMNPTLVAGDRVVVNKLAYNLRIPFTLKEVKRWATPVAGDVITFDSPADGVNLIKRVVAVEGDTVAMVDNQLIVNDVPQARELVDAARRIPTEQGTLALQVWRESLGTRSHETALIPELNLFKDFEAVNVPPGHVLVLGDSRDNSRDSRFLGFIDIQSITGRAERVVMSHNPDHFYLPRSQRWWLALDEGV